MQGHGVFWIVISVVLTAVAIDATVLTRAYREERLRTCTPVCAPFAVKEAEFTYRWSARDSACACDRSVEFRQPPAPAARNPAK